MTRRLCTVLALSAFLFTAVQAAGSDLKKVAIGIDWFVDPNHGPLVVALERGFFADEGLDVTLVPPENTMDNVTMVLDGRVAIGMSDQPRTQIEIAKGSPLMIIGTLIPEPLNVVLGVRGGPVASIADLRGKRVGYADSETTESDLLRISLAAHGIDLSDVTLVNVGFDMVPALLESKVDVLTDAYSNFEPIQVELAGKTPLVLDIEKGAMPAYSELVYIVNTEIVDPDVVDPFPGRCRARRAGAGQRSGCRLGAVHPIRAKTRQCAEPQILGRNRAAVFDHARGARQGPLRGLCHLPRCQ